MLQLHSDPNFHYETMRALGTVPHGGADITEILQIMDKIQPGDFDSWYNEWMQLAKRVLSAVDESHESRYSPVTLRNVYFRASHYIFVADFFLHGNRKDPRMAECYSLWRHYFDKANALLPIPGKHFTVHSETGSFDMPAIIFRAPGASENNRRPTLIIGGGFESIMEETYHVFGPPALERGYNVVIYEGPGHRALVNEGQGFIAEWEQAVTPIVDTLLASAGSDFSFVDTNKLGLVGMSLGGYLAARAAAFEPRLAAVMCIDGVYDMLETSENIFSHGKAAWVAQDAREFDRLFEAENAGSASTNFRWFHDDLKYTFCKDSAFEAYQIAAKMSLAGGVAQRIGMPAYVADAAADIFFAGQPERVVDAIGPHATLKVFDEGLGAQLHYQSGALVYLNQDMMEWFAGVVGH